jgi:hypothetical protein
MRVSLVAASLIALAACNKQPSIDLKNAKPKDVANAVARSGGTAEFVRPGKWVTTSNVTEATLPGMSPEMSARMKKAMSRTSTSESCITEADVKKPKTSFFGGDQEGCTYDHFTMAGGTLDVKMTCKGNGGGGAMSMAIAGTYTGDHYTAHMTMAGSGAGPAGGGMTIKANVEAKRVGECTKAEEDKE